MASIEIRDLTVRYPRAAQPALQGVSLSARAGETLLLLGPSGCGKSTIGLCLAGLVPASIPAAVSGGIRLDGRDAALLGVGERTARVGIVFQDPDAQFCLLTVEEEVAFGLENLAVPPGDMDGRIGEALAAVGLASRRRERVDRLSGGQKQRLALACALARRPDVLFLDEPTSNLDPAARHEFFALLERLRRERPELIVIVVEHNLDELVGMVDRVAALDGEGRLALSGSPADVFGARGEELDRLGIWLPQVTELARRLRAAGLEIGGLPLTVAEAARELRRHLARRAQPAPPARPPHAHAALAAPGLVFGYGDGPKILHGVSLEVPAGSFCALVGPNGAGKTTLAAHFAGIIAPRPGRVLIGDDDAAALSAAATAGRVGYVFQNPEHQFVERRVDDELAFGLRLRKRPPREIEEITGSLLADFGLARCRAMNPFSLSQGQKRRLSVATMLALGQRTLVLDEPTFGQDRRTAAALMERLRELHARGVTLLAITHDLRMVAEHADRAIVLIDGRVRSVLPTRSLFADAGLLAEASLRPLPLHDLARGLSVSYADGTLPLALREWDGFFDTAGGAGASPGGTA